jgi:hypothetical protein
MEDKIQGIQDQLSALAESVTESVLAGLQKPDGLLAQQDIKIDLLSEKLLKLFPMVKQILGLNSTRPLSPTPAVDDSPGKKQKLDASTPMSGVQTSQMVPSISPSVHPRAGFEALFRNAFSADRRDKYVPLTSIDNAPNEACGHSIDPNFDGLYVWSNNVNTLSLNNELADLHELCRQFKEKH